jgi:hypothetical protein
VENYRFASHALTFRIRFRPAGAGIFKAWGLSIRHTVPILPRDSRERVKLLELKGPEARVLSSKRHLHRGLAPALVQALAQVRDYDEYVHDSSNLVAVEKALGYIPEISEKAVLIGRTPPSEDTSLWEKRKSEQPSVRIITYDEVLQEHRTRHAWRRRH